MTMQREATPALVAEQRAAQVTWPAAANDRRGMQQPPEFTERMRVRDAGDDDGTTPSAAASVRYCHPKASRGRAPSDGANVRLRHGMPFKERRREAHVSRRTTT